MKSKQTNEGQENTNGRNVFSSACMKSCKKVLAQIGSAKDAIFAEARGTLKVQDQMLRLALNEAEALAWQTLYPHLVFRFSRRRKSRALPLGTSINVCSDDKTGHRPFEKQQTITRQKYGHKYEETMKPAIEINDTNFESEVLQSNQPVLVDFWAEWCGPCKMLAPLLNEIATEQAGLVKIAKVNVDANPELAARFGIQSIPTLLYFAGGEVRDKSIGVTGKRAILSKLEKLAVPA